MSAGRILTLGLGNPFAGVKYLPTIGYGTSGVAPPTPTPTPADTHDGFGYDYHRKHGRSDKQPVDRDEVRRAVLAAFAEADEVLSVAEPRAAQSRQTASVEPVAEIAMQDVMRALRSLDSLDAISEQLTRAERRQADVKRRQLLAIEEEFALLMVLAQL